ncbi:MAG: hypothetical protein HYY25_10650 [Candidatus Wallbacteria bacterium]|nr:hypothetical protein [Candidatus Wallbacteria bacterium]
MRSRRFDGRGSAMLIALFVIISALGLVLILYQRSETLRTLSRRSRFGQQAEVLALSAIEEARLRFLGTVNQRGTPAFDFVRTADPTAGSLPIVAEGAKAEAAAGPAWPTQTVEPVAVRIVDTRRKVRRGADEISLDWPYDRAYLGQVRFQARAKVDLAERLIVQYFDCRLSNLRPPVPSDRVKYFIGGLGGMEARQLGDVLSHVNIDEGPEDPLEAKVTSFVLMDEPAMADSFQPLVQASAFDLPVAAASYVLPTAAAALRFLYPVEADPTLLALPEAIVMCGEGLELPEWSRFRAHGKLAFAGDVRLGGIVREVPEGTDELLVLQALGKNRVIRADDRPVEASLVAMGERALVEPTGGTVKMQVHGCIASAIPSSIFQAVLVYDPLCFNGRAAGSYRAPSNPGDRAIVPGSGDAEPAAYGFSMAQYPVATVSEAP